MALQIEKLSKRFRNNWVLRDVGFTALPGQVFGICGATGSGKSSLLSAIAGIGKTSGGTIRLNEKDLTAVKSKERGIDLVTNDEATGIFAYFSSVSRKESGGEHQAAALKHALAGESKVLLLDDPFNEMDPALREECILRVKNWAKSGRIVVFATSDFDQLTMAADEMAMLDQNGLSEARSPKDFYEEPPTVLAARLTGDNNLFEARRLSSSDSDLPEFFHLGW